jgi:hypothetical protein
MAHRGKGLRQLGQHDSCKNNSIEVQFIKSILVDGLLVLGLNPTLILVLVVVNLENSWVFLDSPPSPAGEIFFPQKLQDTVTSGKGMRAGLLRFFIISNSARGSHNFHEFKSSL